MSLLFFKIKALPFLKSVQLKQKAALCLHLNIFFDQDSVVPFSTYLIFFSQNIQTLSIGRCSKQLSESSTINLSAPVSSRGLEVKGVVF